MTAHALAACIALAEKAADGDLSPQSEVYWYTREACFELTREQSRSHGPSLCFTWGRVVGCLKDLSFSDEKDLIAMAGDLWDQTMHPAVLVDAVHNH